MNSTIKPCPPHRAAPRLVAQLGGIVIAGVVLVGCARRPVVVHAVPPAPQPTATIIHTPAPVVAAPPVVESPTRDVVVIREAPPPPRDELPPPAPTGPGAYTWVPGYWSVSDGRPAWVPGRYEIPPHARATWVAPRWERRADGYVFIDGYWR